MIKGREVRAVPGEYLDRNWAREIEEIAAFQAYELLGGDPEKRQQEKQKFLSGENENPELDYPQLNQRDLEAKEQHLLALLKDILLFHFDRNSNEVRGEAVKRAYISKITEKLAEIRLLYATHERNWQKFFRYSKWIYGEPNQTVLADVLDSIHTKITAALTGGNSEQKRAAAELQTFLPRFETATLPKPDSKSFLRVQTEVESSLPDNLPIKQSEVGIEEIQAAFSVALESLGADDWSVALRTDDSRSISVDQENKKVKIPPEKTLTVKRLQALLAHEIQTHVARRVRGSGPESTLRLLGIGLAGYEQFEEGWATAKEQVLDGKVEDFSRLDYYLGIALAAGTDGTPRNFRQVFEILQRYYAFQLTMDEGKSYDAAVAKAQDKAWDRCVRTFRGTDCQTPGVCFTKDMIYREGNIGTWTLVHYYPELVAHFDIGKYDATNQEHLEVLVRVGMLPEDILKIEKT